MANKKFLDLDGLETFWTDIQVYLDDKADGSDFTLAENSDIDDIFDPPQNNG